MDKESVRQGLRKTLMALPGGKALLRLRASFIAHRPLSAMRNAEEVFRHYYESNRWGSTESVSGEGSTLRYTKNIRRVIPHVVEELGIRVLLDAPCGDYNWFGMIEWRTGISYIGGDIVKSLIERNRLLHGDESTKFIRLDIVNDALPNADLWLCRDCLFHLSEHDIFLVLDNFLASDIAYLLASNHSECSKNSDIPTGSFRLLNLQLPPFGLSNPTRVIDDWIEGYPVKHLALWEREAVRDALASNKAFRRLARSRRSASS